MVLWNRTKSFASEYQVEMYPHSSSSSSAAYYSSSNTPPPPMFYQNLNPVQQFGYGRNVPVMEMPMDQQMYFHPIQPENPEMMAQQYIKTEEMVYDQQQFVAQPVAGMPDGIIYGQAVYPVMNFMVPYHQPPVMDQLDFATQPLDYDDSMGNIENIAPRAPEQRRKRKDTKKSVTTGGKMHQNTECVNCGCRETKMWRRNERGEPECNPCNLYERCNGSKRPAKLWNKPTIRRRRRPAVDSSSEAPVEQEAGPSAKMTRVKTEIDN